MKKLLFILLVSPFLSTAQERSPRFENDTLYTSCGYKIFRGQTLDFAKGLKKEGRFKYVTVKNGFLTKTLTNSSVLVKELKHYAASDLDTYYIDITGYIFLKNGASEYIVLHIAFDHAIENSPVLPSELTVPDEFRNKFKRDIKKEKLTALNLYEDKVITKAEYEALKLKLIE